MDVNGQARLSHAGTTLGRAPLAHIDWAIGSQVWPSQSDRKRGEEMARDPVCGMECDPRTSEKVEYRGEDFYFCNPGCKAEFEKNPQQYVHHAGEHHGVHGEHGGTHRGGHH